MHGDQLIVIGVPVGLVPSVLHAPATTTAPSATARRKDLGILRSSLVSPPSARAKCIGLLGGVEVTPGRAGVVLEDQEPFLRGRAGENATFGLERNQGPDVVAHGPR